MGVLWGKIGEGVVRYWPLTNSFFLLGVLTSMPILVKIDQEMRPWECSQTDRQTDRLTDWHTDRLTDANRFYNLSHCICYSYGTDKNEWTVLFVCARIYCHTVLKNLSIAVVYFTKYKIANCREITFSWKLSIHPLTRRIKYKASAYRIWWHRKHMMPYRKEFHILICLVLYLIYRARPYCT